MGYLMKEALKGLCGLNSWSYAVFWKIGCQNPRLLIWEECYYGPDSCSGPSTISRNGNSEITLQDHNVATENNKTHCLVKRMMMDNRINVVGEGLVGRVAFTGNHQWILAENFHREVHPPEVLKELGQQFSAALQTVAVIPALPHGVVQLGSHKTILENVEFVNYVVSMLNQLQGAPSSIWKTENYAAEDVTPENQFPACRVYSTLGEFPDVTGASSSTFNNLNYVGCLQHDQPPYAFQNEMQSAVQESNSSLRRLKFTKEAVKAQTFASSSNDGVHDLSVDNTSDGNTQLSDGLEKMKETSVSNTMLTRCSDHVHEESELSRSKEETPLARNIPLDGQNENLDIHEPFPGYPDYDRGPSRSLDPINYDYACSERRSGDDLYDILGADFKNRLFSNCTQTAMITHDSGNNKSSLDSGIISLTDCDHLLDAMVSKVRSCSANLSSCSTSNASIQYARFDVSDHTRDALVDIPNNLANVVNSSSLSTVPEEDSRTYSQCSSIIDSCVKNDCTTILNDSVSKSQTGRKRLKPGENPRPRPKDRQMIQDRLKELREIIPNGAKCSIDALLERTIKHMLFLQSVRKHADKLEQVSQSKFQLVGEDGGVLLKDNFEGGATWAYELGSRSMVCPIMVEDLSQSRQMLVEMLCEERCMFLEIADIIRGLGLTILKGLMEARNEKIWARFAVEANRDVTRMEIFLSLVRLLEQNCKTGMNISNDSAMVQQFSQLVPATGRSPNLQ